MNVDDDENNNQPLPPKILQYLQQNSDNRVPPTNKTIRKHMQKESLQQRLVEISLEHKLIDDKLNDIANKGYVF